MHGAQLLGSAGTLDANREWSDVLAPSGSLYAEVLTIMSFPQMLRFHEENPSAATLGICHMSEPSRCGIAIIDERNRIEQLIATITNPPGGLALQEFSSGRNLCWT